MRSLLSLSLSLFAPAAAGCVNVVINNGAGSIDADVEMDADVEVDADIGGDPDTDPPPPVDVFGPGPWVSVSAGIDHTCAVRQDGTALCRGVDDAGETQVPAGQWISIAAGLEQTCGIRQDGSIQCWGSLTTGLTMPPPGSFTALDVATSGACALDDQGFAVCWGDPDLQVPPANLAMDQISVGPGMACGHTVDDEIACWGDAAADFTLPDDDYQAVSASHGYLCAVTVAGALVCDGGNAVGTDVWPGPPPDDLWFAAVDNLQLHSCARRLDGAIECWGASNMQATVPAEPFAALSAGVAHACGITGDTQHIRCWGVPSGWGE